MDGLPGHNHAQQAMKEHNIAPLKKMVGALADPQYRVNKAGFGAEHLLLAAMVGALFTVITLLYGRHAVALIESLIPADAGRAMTSPLAT